MSNRSKFKVTLSLSDVLYTKKKIPSRRFHIFFTFFIFWVGVLFYLTFENSFVHWVLLQEVAYFSVALFPKVREPFRFNFNNTHEWVGEKE